MSNQEPQRIPIDDLIQTADDNGIFLIPVGCNTAETGASIGSTRNISTDQIVTLAARLSERNRTLGDIVWALKSLGAIRVRFDQFGRATELIVSEKGRAKGTGVFASQLLSAPGSKLYF